MSKSKRKQFGGFKADATRVAKPQKAKVVDTSIDLTSLTPNELSIPGVHTALRGNMFYPANPQEAQALVWLNRQNGNPNISRKTGFRGNENGAYFDPTINQIHAGNVSDYLAELSHAQQLKNGTYGDQGFLENVQEFLFPQSAYNTPGTIEYGAHSVIQPQLENQYNALRMNNKGEYLRKKLSFQDGGLNQAPAPTPTVRLEKGEIYRDTQGNLNRVKKNAPSHQSKEGGVELDNVESVISDSFTQVAKGDRKSNLRENLVKFKPEQINELGSSMGLRVNAKRSLSPTKTFDLLKEAKDKLTKKYLNKTDDKPDSKFAETSLQLNFQNAAQIPDDQDIYDAVFGVQEEKKGMVPQLFNEGAITDEAQMGGNVRKGSFEQWRNNLPANLKNTDTTQYNLRGAYEAGLKPELNADGTYHLGSRNPKTGELLKYPNHPTYNLMLQGEQQAGYEVYEMNGKQYSKPKLVQTKGKYQFGGKLARGGTQAVANYQQMLRDAGYDISTDGAWGAKTQRAYEDYISKQKTPGLDVTFDPNQSSINRDLHRAELYLDRVNDLTTRDPYVNNRIDPTNSALTMNTYNQVEGIGRSFGNNRVNIQNQTNYAPGLPAPAVRRTRGTTSTFSSNWETPVINGASTDWHTPVIQDVEDIPLKGNQYYQWKQQQGIPDNAPTRTFGPQNRNRWFNKQFGGGNALGVNDVSMQGYRYDSPYQNASSLVIDGGNIDMSATPQDLALIPIKNQEIDWMNAQIAQAWDQNPYQMNADQVLEIPMEEMQSGGFPRLTPKTQGFPNISRTGKPNARMKLNGKDIDLYLTTRGTYMTKEGEEFSWDPSQKKFSRNLAPDGYVDPTGTVQKFLPNQGTQNPTPDLVVQENGKSKPVFQSGSGYVDESGKKVPKRKVKSQVQNGKAAVVANNPLVASDLGINSDSFNAPILSQAEMDALNTQLPLEDQNVIDKNAQMQGLLNTPEYRRNNNTAPSVSGTPAQVTQSGSMVPRKNRFDFSSPELTTATGLALADSYNTIPALRQTARLRTPLQRLIDPTQALTEISAQNKATMQNVNPNSTVGQAFQAQVDASTNRTIASTLNQINTQNAQIEYQNAANLANTANQEQQMNLAFDRQYYQDNLLSQEAARQQRMNTIQNWAMNQQRQRTFRNNLALNELIAPYFVGNDLQNIGDRNGKQVVFSGGSGSTAASNPLIPATTTSSTTGNPNSSTAPTRRRSSKTVATTPWETPQMNSNTINVLNQVGTTPYITGGADPRMVQSMNQLQGSSQYQNLTPQQQQLLMQSIQANFMNLR